VCSSKYDCHKAKDFWSYKSDSHEDIIEEFSLTETVANKITFVRIEITPDSGILSDPINKWTYRVDQDKLPDWYDEKSVEKSVRKRA